MASPVCRNGFTQVPNGVTGFLCDFTNQTNDITEVAKGFYLSAEWRHQFAEMVLLKCRVVSPDSCEISPTRRMTLPKWRNGIT
jgi:hypothetical protein